MTQYVIHIGYSKTGTTAVQNFLAQNRSVLGENGVLYPDIRYKGTYLGARDHNLLAWTMTGKHSWFRMPPTEYIRQIERQVERSPLVHTVSLSGESFAGVPAPWDFPSAEEYVAAQKRKIHDLRELLADHPVQILVYLRRQDLWVNSAINHIIKTEGLVGRPLFQSVDAFLNLIHPRLDYHAVLAMWAKEFGERNIIVAPYEKAQFKNGDLFDDFLERIGIASADGFDRPPRSVETENVRLSRDVLEVKRILNRVPKKKYEEQAIIKALQQVTLEMGDCSSHEVHYFGPRERLKLLRRYESGNKAVAIQYLGRENGRLFLEPWPDSDEPWEPYPGLSVEKAVEILFRLQRKLNSRPLRWDYLRFASGRWLRQHALWLHALLRPLYRLLVRYRSTVGE